MANSNELDTILVANPDINCDDTDTEVGFNHKEYFEVRWSGHPHRIAPGGTKLMPRFLAEHYAKHLANHILQKMEEKTGKRGLVQSPVERPRVLNQIMIKVTEYFEHQSEKPEGERAIDMVEELNKEEEVEMVTDVGEIPNPAVGVLVPEPTSNKDI